MMDSDYSDKKGVSVLMDLFEMKGIRKLVMSPGSRNAPLLFAVTADRPAEWIDQDEGQTIRQEGAMAGFVKSYCSLRAEFDTSASAWYANRRLNEVLNHALMPRRGPVHINMSFCEPLYGISSGYSGKERAITFVRERQELP